MVIIIRIISKLNTINFNLSLLKNKITKNFLKVNLIFCLCKLIFDLMY